RARRRRADDRDRPDGGPHGAGRPGVQRVSARTVVIGAGAAGLWCALHASERGAVTVIAPGAAELTATAWAQGGVAAVAAADDSPEQHAADTIAPGGGPREPGAAGRLRRARPDAPRGRPPR